MAGKQAIFNCKIKLLKKPKEVEINDEFAKMFGAKDLGELKKKFSDQINNEFKNSLNLISKNQILSELEQIKMDELPTALIEEEIKLLQQGQNEDEIKKNKIIFEKTAKKRIKLGLILNEIGEKNNIKVDSSEVQSEIQKQLSMMPGQEKIIMEYYKKNPSASASIRGNIYEDKIINFIKSKAKSVKKTVSQTEAEKILKIENNKILDQQKKTQKTSYKNIRTDKKKVDKQALKKKIKKVSKK